jgi:hypothetical protein
MYTDVNVLPGHGGVWRINYSSLILLSFGVEAQFQIIENIHWLNVSTTITGA